MGGLNDTVEVYESLVRAKGKYNRGRVSLEKRWGEIISENTDANKKNNIINYECCVENPWIFGLCYIQNCRIEIY